MLAFIYIIFLHHLEVGRIFQISSVACNLTVTTHTVKICLLGASGCEKLQQFHKKRLLGCDPTFISYISRTESVYDRT